MWQQAWRYVFLTVLRPMLKWLLRRVTGKCELQRIIYSTQDGARRTLKIETSLKHSKCQTLRHILEDHSTNIDDTVNEIHKIKGILAGANPTFGPSLRICLCQICGYRRLFAEIEDIRKVKYSSDNQEHESMLMELWHKLCPDIPLESRISKQWGDIGFQGDDPMTDFRGMGLLGLQNLHFLVTQYTDTARKLLSHSNHPQYGYSFAIVGINITGLAYKLLSKNHLKTHLYNTVRHSPALEHFHLLYCQLFWDFDQFWRDEKPRDIMEFNVVKDKYEKNIINLLRTDKGAILKTSFTGSDSK